MSAGSSADAAEMTQMQRIVRVCPPRANIGSAAAIEWEQAAENAKGNAIRFNAKTLRRKDAKENTKK